jgi:phospholipase C
MNLTKLRPTQRKLAAALCTTFLVSSACLLLTTTGDTAENDIQNSNGGSHKEFDASATRSPIKHVIILIGENRSFDNVFGVYKPKGEDQTISNLLSKGIVNADGTPGSNYKLAQQYSVTPQPSYYSAAPNVSKTAYSAASNPMPQPNTNSAPQYPHPLFVPYENLGEASVEKDVEPGDLNLLTTGATGLQTHVLDTRVPGAGRLAGPYVLQGPNLTAGDYTGDTQHQFYQAVQQQDCSMVNATPANPTGCLNDLFPFVMSTYSSASANNSAGNSMGFYDAEQGQLPLLKALADRFTLSDNYHQPFLGGTGPNHFMLGTGDAGFWSDGQGNAMMPPSNQIANPNPQPGTNNLYIANPNNAFSACADTTQPGVGPIVQYLNSLPYAPQTNCLPSHYYMLNNTNPAYLPNGYPLWQVNSGGGVLPPSSVRTIGDALNDKKISWGYFGGAYNEAVKLSNAAVAETNANGFPWGQNLSAEPDFLGATYCQICNPFQYSSSIMGDANQRATHIKDTSDLISAIKQNTLPAVSFAKPDSNLDGHPQSSKPDLFEAYVRNILDALQANPELKAETAVFITWDEAGGYYDSGFVQPIDYFGDGPRIPLIVLSPYSTGGRINHSYGDHASLLKFIERNWKLQPLTNRSRDNLPNPKVKESNLYVPTNMPALDDLWDAFDFDREPNLQRYIDVRDHAEK